MSRKLTTTERELLAQVDRRNKLHQRNPSEWNFLYAEPSFNRKRYRLKASPDVFCDLDRNTDVDSILVGTWKWIGPDGKEGGPHLKVEDCLREMNRAFSLGQPVNPRTFWRGVARTASTPRLRLLP
jgi:hypothetical protein